MSVIPDTLRRRLRREDGWAMVTAMMLMVIMLGSSLAVASYVDTQTRQSRVQRTRETAFNLAESALNQQVVALGRLGSWSTRSAIPACTPTATDSRCPAPSQLSKLIPSSDVDSTYTWRTDIRDDQSPYTSFYDDGLLSSTYSYDANGNHKVWVRATATARGKTRTLVALVREVEQPEDIIHAGILAGALDLSNNGNKVVIDGSLGGAVDVHCTPVQGGTPCVGYGWKNNESYAQLMNRVGQQIQPANVTPTYPSGPILSADTLARKKDEAQNHYPDTVFVKAGDPCPTSLTGTTVWLDVGVNCDLSFNGGEFNTAQKPGFLIMNGGTLTLEGTAEYYGVIYHPTTAATNAVKVQGDATVHGGVLVDGNSVFIAGSSHLNIDFNPIAFDAIRSYGTAGVIQNTWREIHP
jgi:type II secretory pathway pseudopilin PulG